MLTRFTMWRHALRRRLFEFVRLGERKNYCTTSERKTSFGFEEVTEETKAKKGNKGGGAWF